MALQYQRSSAPRKILSDVLIKMGFEKRYIHRSLTVYEKHYNVMHIGYNIPILKEIIFRIKIKDILKDSQITYHSKVNLHHALESMDFSSELIRSALQIYDDEHQSDSSHAYILKDICSILMQLRANRFHKQQMQQHTADNSLDTKDSGTTNNISINNYHDAEMYYKNTNLTRDTDIHTNWRDLRSLQYKPSKLDLPEHKTRITTYTSYEKLQLAMKSVSSNGIEDSQMISEFNSPKQVLSQSGVTSTVMPSPSPPIVISVPPSIPRIIMNEQGSLDGYNLLKSDCKLRHFVLIWLPVLDILTDDDYKCIYQVSNICFNAYRICVMCYFMGCYASTTDVLCNVSFTWQGGGSAWHLASVCDVYPSVSTICDGSVSNDRNGA
eukprot:749676_1